MPSRLNRLFIMTGAILAVVLVVAAIMVASLPAVTKWYVSDWLQQRGVSSSIGEIRISLLDGQFQMKSVHVIGPSSHKLDIGNISVQLNMPDLLDNRVTIEKIHVADFYLDIYQELGKKIRFSGISLDNDETDTAASDAEPWQVTILDASFSKIGACVQVYSEQVLPLYDDCISISEITWDGEMGYRVNTANSTVLANLDAKLSLLARGVNVHDRISDSDIANIEKLSVDGIASGSDNVAVKSVRLENYSMFRRANSTSDSDTYIASFRNVGLSDLAVKLPGEINISNVAIDGMNAYLYRQPDGDFEPVRKVVQLLFPEAGKNKTQVVESKDEVATKYTIGHLVIAGDSIITARDEGINPAYAGTARNIQVTVANIDSSLPANRSPVDIAFVAGEHGKVRFSGDLAIFAERSTGQLDGTLRSVDAADFSAYLNGSLQHHITSGQVDADVKMSVDKGKLDSVVDFVFHKFYVAELSETEASAYREKLGVPLATALNLLREKDDSIKLKLHISGDIENPDFSVNEAIRKVTMDAIRQAVINYYTPFGLVTITRAAFNLATALRFDPVLFEPGMSDLNDEGKRRLDKIIVVMQERPGIKLLLCGKATLDDRFSLFPPGDALAEKVKNVDLSRDDSTSVLNDLLPALANQESDRLNTLARLRAKAATDYIVATGGIEESRIIKCSPRYANEASKPQVTLTL